MADSSTLLHWHRLRAGLPPEYHARIVVEASTALVRIEGLEIRRPDGAVQFALLSELHEMRTTSDLLHWLADPSSTRGWVCCGETGAVTRKR